MVKSPTKEELLGFYLPVSLIMTILFLGLILIPAGFQVQPEYIDTILASSSILFGFWAVALGIQPVKKEVKELYSNLIGLVVLTNVGFLAFSVILVFFTAMEKLASKYALTFVTVSFLFNMYSVALYIYFVYTKGLTTQGLEKHKNH